MTTDIVTDNSSKKPYYKKDEDEKESENFTIEDILASQMDNEEIELDNEEFEQRLADADIINISAANSLINKKLFNKLKATAQSQSIPCINVDELKKWIKKNYTRKVNTTLSNLRSTTMIEGFDTEQFDFLQAGHGEKLDLSMDENTYTATIVSPDFETLKLCFPTLFISRWNENEVPSSKWRCKLIYGVGYAHKADGILFNYDNVDQEFLLFENVGPPSKTKEPKYCADLLKCFRNSVDAICKAFWNGNGDVELAKKYYVLSYVLHENEGELYRLNLGAPKAFVAEKILKNYTNISACRLYLNPIRMSFMITPSHVWKRLKILHWLRSGFV
ncbi:4099_t:CDS:2 [Entrophospora sp. SA101]|nr:4099_t:CDS:2 [Entrophospora sp. SA101]